MIKIEQRDRIEEGIFSAVKKIAQRFIRRLLSRNDLIVDFDFDIPDAYHTQDGDLIGYYAYLENDDEIRLNYEVGGDQNKLFSVDLIRDGDAYDNPSRTILLDPDASNREINNAITDLITNNLVENSFTEKEKLILERRSPAQESVFAWIEEPEFLDARLDIIQDEKLSNVYTEYVRTTDGRPVSQSSFVTYVKQYLNNNGLINRWTRGAYTVRKKTSINPIVLPEEEKYVQNISGISGAIFSWQEAFEDMEDDFEELMDDPKRSPFGQIVFGNGGTGKSYYYIKTQEKKIYDMEIIKGAPNTARLVRYLYDYRNKDVIVFDDADSVITNANSANILKMATDDTVASVNNGSRIIYLPKGSGKDMRDIVPDVYDSDGKLSQAFYFNASVVVITNLPDVKDKALKTRMYLNPVFMTKEDIIEKIMLTVDPSEFGATEADSKLVANLLVELVENDDFDITNDQLSYRFFKMGLKLKKRYPDRWTGKVLRKLGIGIKTSYKDLKNGREVNTTRKVNERKKVIAVTKDVQINKDTILEAGDRIVVENMPVDGYEKYPSGDRNFSMRTIFNSEDYEMFRYVAREIVKDLPSNVRGSTMDSIKEYVVEYLETTANLKTIGDVIRQVSENIRYFIINDEWPFR